MFRLILDVVLMFAVVLPGIASAQDVDITNQVESLSQGEVRMSFPARDGVCGDGENTISTDSGRVHYHGVHHDGGLQSDCEEGPVRVALKIRDGEVTRLRVRVGGSWPPPRDDRLDVLDIGEVSAADAVRYLLTLAGQGPDKVGEEAIFASYLARDVVIWPELLTIARDGTQEEGVREAAIFWLSQIAGEKVTAGLEKLVADDDEGIQVREHAIFALTQRGEEVYIPTLMNVSRTSRHPQLREVALFWLAQSDDSRVLDYFEEILLEN